VRPERAPEKDVEIEAPGPQVVRTILPDSLSSRPEVKPEVDAVAAIEEASADEDARSSPSASKEDLPPVEPEGPAYGFDVALRAGNALPGGPPSVSGTQHREDSGPPEPLEAWTTFPYSLRLGAFRTLARAKKAVEEYKQKGLSSYWTQVDLGDKGTWFRVYTGHFEGRGKAKRFREEHDLDGALVKETQYTTLVGVYENEDELERKILSLQNLDYCPYTLKDQDGRHRLLVGAFITEEGAQAQQRDLEAKGVQSEVIRR
jgi:cell division septation protein DedD